MAVIAEFCNCQPDAGLCCESQTDLLAVSVYYLAAALKEMGGADFTNIEALKTEYRDHAAYLSDTKGAAYAAQLSQCLANGVGVLPQTTYAEAKKLAKNIQSTFAVRDLTMIQGMLTWLVLRECLCGQPT